MSFNFHPAGSRKIYSMHFIAQQGVQDWQDHKETSKVEFCKAQGSLTVLKERK